MKISVETREALYVAGRVARCAAMPRATATCVKFAEVAFTEFPRPDVKTFKILCDEWYEGYDAYADEVVADLFKDDEFFLAKIVSNKQRREARLARLGE
jgi:hypothetical protein